MMRVRAALLTLGLVLASATAPACVSAPPPVAPEGFTLSIELHGIRLSVVENIRIVIVPQVIGGVSPRFAAIDPYDAGGVQVSVDGMGRLVLGLTREYVQANGVPSGAGDLDPRIDVEVWSDDEVMREGPQILGYVVIGGSQLGIASAYFPIWPLPLGTRGVLPISCAMGYELQCAPPP